MKKNKFSVSHAFFSIFYWSTIFLLIACFGSVFIDPNWIVFIAPFGLAYPICVALSIVVLFFVVLLKQWRRLILILFILCLAYPLHTRYYSFGKSSESQKPNSIKVMSYNVRLFNLYNWNKTKNYQVRDSIFSFLSKTNPDVICFQEFYYADSAKFKTKDTLLEFLKANQFHGKFTKTIHQINQYYGIATLSAFPIVNRGLIELKSVVSNFCIYSDIKKGLDTIRIYNAHIGSIQLGEEEYAFFENLESGGEITKESNLVQKILKAYRSRASEIKRIMNHIKKSPYPVVLCGDFNDTPVSYCYQKVSRVLLDAFLEAGRGLGATYAGKIPPNRIDYIFHSDEFKATRFRIQKEVLSDHRAVWATLNY